MDMRRILDPLYGRVNFDALAWETMRSPEVQRLRYVRMCNINSLLIVGASDICRYEHALGVYHLATLWANSNKLLKDEREVIQSAALIHDFFSGPFGHSLQYVLEDNDIEGGFEHEELKKAEENYYQVLTGASSFMGVPFQTKEKLANRWVDVAETIAGRGRYAGILSGTIDLDNIDNVFRLAYHAGLATQEDARVAERLAIDISNERGKLAFSAERLPDIQRWYDVRCSLYKMLLEDWADFSAKAMLTNAFEDAAVNELVGVDSWVNTDLGILSEIIRKAVGEHQRIAVLLKRLIVGDLYQPVILLQSASVGAYKLVKKIREKRKIEGVIKDRLKDIGISGQFLFHPILDSRKTGRSVSFKIKGKNKNITIGSDINRLLVGVFVSNSASMLKSMDQAKLIIKEVLERFGVRDATEISDPVEELYSSFDSSQQEMLFDGFEG
jgi:HD superfamily phosphohydrolase